MRAAAGRREAGNRAWGKSSVLPPVLAAFPARAPAKPAPFRPLPFPARFRIPTITREFRPEFPGLTGRNDFFRGKTDFFQGKSYFFRGRNHSFSGRNHFFLGKSHSLSGRTYSFRGRNHLFPGKNHFFRGRNHFFHRGKTFRGTGSAESPAMTAGPGCRPGTRARPAKSPHPDLPPLSAPSTGTHLPPATRARPSLLFPCRRRCLPPIYPWTQAVVHRAEAAFG